MSRTEKLGPQYYQVTHRVALNQAGTRLDSFLKDRYRRRSRASLQRAIETGAITLVRTGKHLMVGRLKPSSVLASGDQVLVRSERKPEPKVNFDYETIYEDAAILALSKPAPLPVHPSGRYFFNTLLTHLQTQGFTQELSALHPFYLVHRIDKETSGILVLAKTKEACASLTKQFAQRKTQKRYLAIVRGCPPDRFECQLPMKRSENSQILLKMTTCSLADGGLEAQTQFRRLETFGNFTLVECIPRTGRQHQIRLHLEAMGYPILGDKLYGLPEDEAVKFYDRAKLTDREWARLLHPRHALHAASLELEHPLTGQRLKFESALAKDLQEFLNNRAILLSQLLQDSPEQAWAESLPYFRESIEDTWTGPATASNDDFIAATEEDLSDANPGEDLTSLPGEE